MVKRLTTGIVALACVASLGLVGCSNQSQKVSSNGCIEKFSEETDYFPDKVTFDEATNVTVEYHKSYKVVTVKEPAPGAAAESYVLVQCGAPEPKLEGDLAKAKKITVPVNKVAAISTTQAPGYELLDKVDHLVAVKTPEKIHDGKVKDAIKAGKIVGIKSQGAGVSVESVAAARPDLVVTSGTADPSFQKVSDLGIPVVANAEWLESSPLGRAEWLKFTALFLNAEKKANEVYGKIRSDYNAVKEKVTKAEGKKPTVLAGYMYKGIFYAANNSGYVGQFIRDAGGDYVLADTATQSGNAKLGVEVILAKAAETDYWINASHAARVKNIQAQVKDDPRLANLKSVKEGKVWNFTKRINEGGGNDYWQSGVTRPDLVLSDLAKIFHPDLMADYEFYYYEQVPKA